ncbi:MAG: glycosyltransferase [Muribaculaceae bacterium]|nr:glycosyltransferase [Muribaculaceae bacterium]
MKYPKTIPNFSVLLSLYIKEHPEYLRQSLDSVFNQTLKPTEVILVLDGPITDELQTVVSEFENRYPQLKVVPLKENQGLGKALNEGLRHCSYELVARMDTDDICYPTRFEEEVKYMDENPDTDICGSWISEFSETTDNILSTRKVPADNQEIAAFIKGRNPFNHPSVMFRKSAVEKAGGYKHFHLLEDWYLWARMFANGAKMHNIQKPLLYFRTSPDMMRRRGGYKYAQSCARLFREFRKLGIINSIDYLKYAGIKYTVALMPNWVRSLIYRTMLR